MKFRIVEQLEQADYRLQNMSTEEFLTSNQLHKSLEKEFGNNYSHKNICDYVSRAVAKLTKDPNVKVAPVLMVLTEDFVPVSTKGHWVVYYNNKVYDYTSNQYIPYGVDEVSWVRVMRKCNLPDNEFIPVDGVTAFKHRNMIVLLEV